MIHLVFETASVAILQSAMEMDASLEGKVLEIKDDYAVGPIADIFETEGYQARRDWWMELLQYSPYEEQLDIVDDKLVVHQLIQELQENENEQVWIWMGQNAHDVCGYYWLMSQLKELQGQVQVLYLNNLPFLNEKGQLFYPTHLSQIQPGEFLKAKKLARPITPSEFEVDADEWSKICRDANGIRLLEGGKKLLPKAIEYYDNELLKYVTGDYQKASKIINQFLLKSKETTGDAFLLWRLNSFVSSGLLEVQGSAKSMNQLELRKATAQKVAE